MINQTCNYEEKTILLEAEMMYDKIFEFKFLPPGRGLWAMGTPITEKKMLYAALNNCAFISTKSNDLERFIQSFVFLMDSTMLGIGVGFDTKGSESKFIVKGYNVDLPDNVFTIDDSREGWVSSIKVLLESFLMHLNRVKFDYSKIREKGKKLNTFGGISSGPQCLHEMHNTISDLLEKNNGYLVDSKMIVDLMNIIGRGVVAGNISINLIQIRTIGRNCFGRTR